MPRKENRDMPSVIKDTLYTNTPANGIQLTEHAWTAWLEDNPAFYYRSGDLGFSVRKQRDGNEYYWYAYKRIKGKLYKRYLGMREALTAERLKAMAQEFAAIARKGVSLFI